LCGQLPEAAWCTVVGHYHLDIDLQKYLKYQIMHLLDEDIYMMKIVRNKKAWFTRVDMLDLIYNIFFFMVNSLGQLPHTAKSIDLVSPWLLAVAVIAIHCAL
jgi:hypothetical protein